MPTHGQQVRPVHVGLILDGNRRWAAARGLPSLEGHRAGYEALREAAFRAADWGVLYLSAFVFSTENWRRSKAEVAFLMNLLVWIAEHEAENYISHDIKLTVLGSWEGVSQRVRRALERAEQRTAHCQKMVLVLCFNYGGKQELAEAMAGMLRAGVAADQVTPELIEQYLYQPEIPPLDLVVRTSGEQRLSNFMLWRAAYAELLFLAKPWPDFAPADMDLALEEYAQRQRRFGK